ncbi:enoyl-CoA hydratase/isomerase family protein [Effusibacillus lacus]|uniref:Enoyl-CoA hydratase n=1 Tax=Effusibacillus lacus TaxID=1348429 RepID=A0A292YJ34_9BACL|nr:enoyl-CoA hydratase-related protein [Effusibacillus lacus]TCS74634.1 2-(1,2-epoxy-1,2-dihydrophenyl)acetyl-CoA isomerase [Effusibacillus lacus]GAX88505.1 enoyl-CoA hydratase [Effusibacillus lacus]
MYKTILFEKSNQMAIIALNRPEVMNAFNVEMHEEVYDALNKAAEDVDVRCIVFRGNGKGFSSGADLKSISREDVASLDHGTYLKNTYNRLLLRMAEIEKPIIGALHGPVFGAGLGVALACDLRIAAASSSYSMAFIKIGLIPDAGSHFFLPRIVGLSRAMELAMLGDTLTSEEALRLGLVNKVVPDEEFEQAAQAYAFRLAQSPTQALGLIKKNMYMSFESDLATVLEAEVRGQSICGRSRDHQEGVTAFFEKRRPNFTGK